MKYLTRLFLLASCCLGLSTKARSGNPLSATDPVTSKDTFGVKYFTGEFFQTASRSENYVLKDFQKYYCRNYLGNIGQALNTYYADQPVAHTGFNYFQNDFAKNLISEDSVRYYDAHHPYTRIFFVTGQKKETDFSFIHSQNINKNLNFAAYFNRIRSDGTYNRQSTNLTSMYLSSNYKSSNKRYYLLGNIIYNVDKPQVNGGIRNDSDFQTAPVVDRKLLAINLTQAQRKYRNRSVYIRQFFNLGYKTKPADSTQKATFVPTSSFTYTFHAGDDAITYIDLAPLDGFYQHIYNDSTHTHDSVYYVRIRNGLGWMTQPKNRNGSDRKWGAYINAEHEWVRLKQNTGDTLLMNYSIRGGLFKYLDTASRLRLRLDGEYIFKGYNQGDYRSELFAEKETRNRSFAFGADAVASLFRPDFMSLLYSSNNFKWKNNFSQEGIYSGKAWIRSGKYFFDLGGFARQYSNLVFYSYDATPQQMTYPFMLMGAYISKDLNLGSWTFANKITYQYNSNPGPLNVPEWITEHSLYFHHNYRDLLNYQIGIDVFYFSSYYSRAYMPATGQFYAQNDKLIGNYPYGDVYISMQIKTVRLFVKYEHVNSGFPSYTYYLAPHYPAPDRALKFGLTWIFNN